MLAPHDGIGRQFCEIRGSSEYAPDLLEFIGGESQLLCRLYGRNLHVLKISAKVTDMMRR